MPTLCSYPAQAKDRKKNCKAAGGKFILAIPEKIRAKLPTSAVVDQQPAERMLVLSSVVLLVELLPAEKLSAVRQPVDVPSSVLGLLPFELSAEESGTSSVGESVGLALPALLAYIGLPTGLVSLAWPVLRSAAHPFA